MEPVEVDRTIRGLAHLIGSLLQHWLLASLGGHLLSTRTLRSAARWACQVFTSGFIVHFFDRALIDRLAVSFELIDATDFTEGELPRRLARVTRRVPQR